MTNRNTKRKKAMGVQEKKDELKKHYDNSKFKTFFTEDCENVTQIDFDSETVYYYVYATASCGCCSEMIDKETELDRFIEYLTDDDYEALLSELKSA
jgi:hypothetical protein